MIWTNELILLAPRILQNKKPLETDCFIGLFTSIKSECSNGFVYLLYKFDNVEQEISIKELFEIEPRYYNCKVVFIKNIRYVVFKFYNKEIEMHKKYGNIGYDIYDYTLIYTFWGDLSKDINHISNTHIGYCNSELDKEKGVDVKSTPLLLFT